MLFILFNTLLFKYLLLFNIDGIWVLKIKLTLWRQNDLKLHHRVNQVMLRSWKWRVINILCNFSGRIISGFEVIEEEKDFWIVFPRTVSCRTHTRGVELILLQLVWCWTSKLPTCRLTGLNCYDACQTSNVWRRNMSRSRESGPLGSRKQQTKITIAARAQTPNRFQIIIIGASDSLS